MIQYYTSVSRAFSINQEWRFVQIGIAWGALQTSARWEFQRGMAPPEQVPRPRRGVRVGPGLFPISQCSYLLANVYIAIFSWVNQIEMAMFNSFLYVYQKVTFRQFQPIFPIKSNDWVAIPSPRQNYPWRTPWSSPQTHECCKRMVFLLSFPQEIICTY